MPLGPATLTAWQAFGVSFLIHPLFGNDTRHTVPLSSSPALKVGASQPPVSPDIYFFGAPTTYYLLLTWCSTSSSI